MKAKLLVALAAAMGAGILAGNAITQLTLCHKVIARWVRGREPIAIVHGTGVYENDARTFAAAALNYRARNESVSFDRELALLRAQFGEDKNWRAALRSNHLCAWHLGRDLKDNLRARAWLDRQLLSAVDLSDEECRDYFAQHQNQFVQPIRYRVAHLFLAAPVGTPDELMETKRRTIDDLAQRLTQGEQFVDLVTQFSEDEATKKRGGDLSWFSDWRMPTDFMDAVRALRIGETSPVVQTKLGFHILRLTETQPARSMSFEEARPEIAAELQNAKRGEAVQKLIVDLAREAQIVRE
ncbi:MAG: peptidyl-prolyl cis-trans isomerase [Verrucomicrobiota bacterium]|jgi:hypothetical protein